MKLLMITRKLDRDDPQMGYTFNWVNKLSQKIEQLKIICLEKGNIEGLNKNVEVFSLGKEKGKNRIKEFINFQRGAWKFINKVDGVFAQQNPEYTILIGPYAKLFRKKIVCFYGHKAINWRVRLMHFFAYKVVTSSEGGFQIDSPKRKVVSQGIDINLFVLPEYKQRSEKLRIFSVGRISPIKDYMTLIKAISILKKKGLDLKVKIAGPILLKEQEKYLIKLKELVKKNRLDNQVEFLGGVIPKEVIKIYHNSDLSVNLCPTGAPDKAGLEAMACGVPLLAVNENYGNDFDKYSNLLLFKEKNPEDLAEKILNLKNKDLEEIGKFLRNQIVNHHSLDNLIKGIIECF